MGTGTLPRPAVLLIAVAALAGLPVPPARAQGVVDQAEAEVRQGTELRRRKQDARALPHFERAYQLSRNPRTAAQLGLVKMALGYCVDAERLLDEALAVPDHPWIARNAAALLQTRESARRNIGQVSITGTPAGAQVLANGHAMGTLPLAAPLRLDRGPVELEVRAAGYTSFTRTLNITASARETVNVALVPTATSAAVPTASPSAVAPAAAASAAPSPPLRAPAPSPAPATPAPAPAPTIAEVGDTPAFAPAAPAPDSGAGAPSLPLRPLAFTAAGLAAAGLVVGIVETVVARNRAEEFNDHTAPAPTPTDPNRRVPDCESSALNDDCRAIRDAHDRARTLAIVGYAGAGVFALTSVYLFVRSANGTSDPTSPVVAGTRLTCAPALLTAGLSCRVVF